MGVVQENEIGEHFDGSVGDMAGQERILEGAILESEQYAPFFGRFGFDIGYAGHASFELLNDPVEDIVVPLVQKLRHQSEVLALLG